MLKSEVDCEPQAIVGAKRARATLSSPRNPRYYSLDLWRGVACLMVVIYHSTVLGAMAGTQSSRGDGGPDSFLDSLLRITHWGRLGVPMFFVISGYCISATSDSSRRHKSSMKTYFLRRFRRIFPPYWTIVLLSVVAVAIVDVWLVPRLLSTQPLFQPRPWWLSATQWLGNITLTQSWSYHLTGEQLVNFVGQAWTLCYEEQFYIVMGLLLLVPRMPLFKGSALVTLFVFVVLLLAHLFDWSIDGFFFDGSWLMFAAGIGVYYILNYSRRPVIGVATLGLATCVAAGIPGLFNAGHISAFAFATVLCLLHPWDRAIYTNSWLRPFSACGVMCYSLYLVHGLPVNTISKFLFLKGFQDSYHTLCITMPICMATSLGLAALFYIIVERRFVNTAPSMTLSRVSTNAADNETIER